MFLSVGIAAALLLAQPTNAAARVAGRVTSAENGSPISGARVILMWTRPPQGGRFGPPPSVVADQDGRFVFADVAPGEYRLEAQKTGYVGHDFTAGPPPQTIHVAAGQVLDGIVLQLRKGAVITGRVLDASGEPLSEAQVMALRRMNGRGGMQGQLFPAPTQGQQTNDIGEFRISGLPAGDYYIAASVHRFSPFGAAGSPAPSPDASPAAQRMAMTTTYYPGTIDQSAARSIAVGSGDTVNGIEITMQSAPAYRITGRVVDENGAAVGGAMVMLSPDMRATGAMYGPAGSARTGSDGRFTMMDVAPGSYRLHASVPVMYSGSGSAGIGAVSLSGRGMSGDTSTQVVVADQDVAGVRIVVRRPQQ